MSALAQYISLHDSELQALGAGGAHALNAMRRKARATLVGDTHLPDFGDEGYEKTSVEQMFAPDYGVNVRRVGIPVDVAASFRCDVPNLSTLQATVVNDRFIPSARLDERLPRGVKFMSLARAAAECPQLVEPHYGTLATFDGNVGTASALNAMMVQDGVFIYIPAGVKVDKPLQLVNIFSSPAPLAAFRRLLVVAAPGAEATLMVCDHTQDTTQRYLASQVAEVIAGPGSRLQMCFIEESSPLTCRHTMLWTAQGEGSAVDINTTTLACGTTRADFNISLDSPRAECRLTGMAIGRGNMHIDNSTAVAHNAPRCHSNQLFKYVMDGTSHGAFEGSITVAPGAPYTEAYQSDRNLLASPSARMHCKPQLIINNDEVKCSHGATTGQLDSDALFYMRSRGIPEAEARRMLMQAFMADVIDSVHIPGLHERLHLLVERSFSGSLGHCDSCTPPGDCRPADR